MVLMISSPRSRRPAVPLRSSLKTFYVYDPGLRERSYLGGIPVKMHNGLLVVAMTDKQAEYWIARGAIGPVPLSDVTNTTRRSMLHQLSGGRIPAKPEGKPSHVVRNARQDPNTMADKVAQGYHPALGTLSSDLLEEERRRVRNSGREQYSEGGGRRK